MSAGQAGASLEGLRAEWLALQANYEQYERMALGIKLLAVLLCALPTSGLGASWLWVLLLVLWLQEAIFKTFQARLGERLLRLESLMAEAQAKPELAMQLHSEWLSKRPRGLGLLKEYALSALRPTVAFPYPILIGLSVMCGRL